MSRLRWFRRQSGPGPQPDVAAPMRRALHLVLSGDLAAAEAELADAARSDSSSVEVYLSLANLYRTRGEIGRAIQIHQNLLLRQELPEALRREALLGLALDFRAGGFLRRAAASFEELLEVQPDNTQALRELELLRVESGNWEAAVRIRRRLVRSDPRTPQILAHLWTGLGREHDKAGREAEARKAFRRALGHDRRCAEAYIALGDQRRRAKKFRKAIGLWNRALPLHPAIGGLLYPRLWEAYTALEDLPSFEALLHARIEAEPTDLEAPLWLSRAIVKMGRIDEGLTVLRHLLERAQGSLPVYGEIGRVLLRESREHEALKSYAELLDRIPAERPRLRCRSCGSPDTELHWRCPQCGEWDSFV